jgi:hypothetical protein
MGNSVASRGLGPGKLHPNKERFKAAVDGCMKASSGEDLELWCELLRNEIALFEDLEKRMRGDSLYDDL